MEKLKKCRNGRSRSSVISYIITIRAPVGANNVEDWDDEEEGNYCTSIDCR